MHKHHSLSRTFINYVRKKFITLAPGKKLVQFISFSPKTNNVNQTHQLNSGEGAGIW